MRWRLRCTLFLVLTLLAPLSAALGTAKPAAAAISPSRCAPDGRQADGAVYRICMPALVPWNHELLVYAHGYVAFNEPVGIPEDQLSLPTGPSIAEIVNSLGYAFAATSYRTNGLAIREGVEDVVDLTSVFSSLHGEPRRIYIAGPSEGGIVTALAVEQYPEVFDGGLSACGPVGDFPSQISYWGDARVTFDHFFPGVLPGSAIEVPAEAIEQWETVYEPRVRAQLNDNPTRLDEWTAVAGIPQHPTDRAATIDALTQLLWYSVFATNDGVQKLGGQPFDNIERIYRGARDDAKLNYRIDRYQGDPNARQVMDQYYQTSGNLTRPLVAIHTTDPLIPLWHEGLYALKVRQMERASLLTGLTFPGRYGHCKFSSAQVLFGFIVLVYNVTNRVSRQAEVVLAAGDMREEYLRLMEQYFPPAPDGEGMHLYLPSVRTPSNP